MIYLIVFILIIIILQLEAVRRQLIELIHLDKTEISKEYNQTVQVQKTKKEPLKAIKQVVRGRSITKTEDLVDIADLPWEDALKIIEDIGK